MILTTDFSITDIFISVPWALITNVTFLLVFSISLTACFITSNLKTPLVDKYFGLFIVFKLEKFFTNP